jgi:hypothetical protein
MSGQALRAGIRIGGVCVGVRTTSPDFLGLLHRRFAGFLDTAPEADYEFDVELAAPSGGSPDDDVHVFRDGREWRIERGDFRAVLDARARRGRIRQEPNPYSIDSLLRIVHTLALAPEGGVLMHAASVVKDGRALVFAGASGAGKTTIASLAPQGVQVLSDEVSYVRPAGDGYIAHGTPFAGELARSGENVSAPLAGIYLLRQGPGHRVDPVPAADAVRAILANVLFFAEDPVLVRRVFEGAVRLAERVPVRRLTFRPDAGVWSVL